MTHTETTYSVSNPTTERERLESALTYWQNCLGKGSAGQRKLVDRTIADLRARLEVLP